MVTGHIYDGNVCPWNESPMHTNEWKFDFENYSLIKIGVKLNYEWNQLRRFYVDKL